MREWHIGKLIRKLWGLGLSAVPELVISTIAGSRIRPDFDGWADF